MCGRTRCTLSADCLRAAAARTLNSNVKWSDGTGSRSNYSPSTNVPPTR